MQTGYVMCSADLNKVLCLNQDKSSVTLVEVENTQDLNRSICLWDLTENGEFLYIKINHITLNINFPLQKLA